jgi:chemotaxis protein methyltransferase CheR
LSEAEEELLQLKQKIERDCGFRCDLYKDKCLRRRLNVRMRARNIDSFGGYAALLDADPGEYDRLVDALTINVTKFFRNREMWDVLAAEIVPRLFAPPGEEVRVWSAGCSSGEEPYSLSILAQQWAEREGRQDELERLRILGTDIDRGCLQAAERAVYPPLSMEETSDAIRSRWFSPGPPFELREEARRPVTFRRADLLTDDPPGGQTLILCRNVIIYFERSVQETLFEAFLDALEPGGYLVLGRVETLVGPLRGRFRTVSHRERIYMKP